MATNFQRLSDIPLNNEIKEMIRHAQWSEEKSGWRPFANRDEAMIILGETLVSRGSNWLHKVIDMTDTGVITKTYLSYNVREQHTQEQSFERLFSSRKLQHTFHPIGLPK